MVEYENRSGGDLGSAPLNNQMTQEAYSLSTKKPNLISLKGLTDAAKNQVLSIRNELKMLGARWEGGTKQPNGKYAYPDRLFYSVPIKNREPLLELFSSNKIPLSEIALDEVYLPDRLSKHVQLAKKIDQAAESDKENIRRKIVAKHTALQKCEASFQDGIISREELDEQRSEIEKHFQSQIDFLQNRLLRNEESAVKIFLDGEKKKAGNKLDESKFVVDTLNKSFAIIETPQFGILEEVSRFEKTPFLKRAIAEKSILIHQKTDLKNRFENQVILLGGNMQRYERNIASVWLKSPERRTFYSLDFRPDQPPGQFEEGSRKIYNTWNGFNIEYKRGNCELFKKHLLEVIASGDEANFRFLWNLFASWVQKPWERTVAPVFRGIHGVGKGIVTETIGEIFGNAYLLTDNHELVFGRFNASLLGKALVHLDEAMFGGDRRIIGQVKGLITASTLPIEMKGRDPISIRNSIKVMISSNESFAIPVDPTERRFVFFDTSSHRKGDFRYFESIIAELQNGGIEALLYELFQTNLLGFNPMEIPSIQKYGFDNKLQSSNTFIQYLHQALLNETFFLESVEGDWQAEIRTNSLFDSYLKFCDARKIRPISDANAGSELKKILGRVGFERKRKRVEGRQPYHYFFPSVELCRTSFASHFGTTINSIFGDENTK